MIEIDLEDAELDKIDYKDLRSYQRYLSKLNEVTVDKVEKNLKEMGLIIMWTYINYYIVRMADKEKGANLKKIVTNLDSNRKNV